MSDEIEYVGVIKQNSTTTKPNKYKLEIEVHGTEMQCNAIAAVIEADIRYLKEREKLNANR